MGVSFCSARWKKKAVKQLHQIEELPSLLFLPAVLQQKNCVSIKHCGGDLKPDKWTKQCTVQQSHRKEENKVGKRWKKGYGHHCKYYWIGAGVSILQIY
jgi:hypothetical protein